MQLLISTGYTKLLVTTQVLFLKYVIKYASECIVEGLGNTFSLYPHEIHCVITKVCLETAAWVNGQGH